jgi:predicted N-formylglutamate amidohydrolase
MDDVFSSQPSLLGLPASQVKIIISCEHAVCTVPKAYQPLFVPHTHLLQTHRGYDRGALVVAKALHQAIGDYALYADYSRLLVDLNRSLFYPGLFSKITRVLPRRVKKDILDDYYFPYRRQLQDTIAAYIAQGAQVIHLSVHSFTPVLNNHVRHNNVSLLYDPKRHYEALFARCWKNQVKSLSPTLQPRSNYPYLGRNDGLTRFFRDLFFDAQYLGIELEINQKNISEDGYLDEALKQLIVQAFIDTLQKWPNYLSVSNPGL